jgi:Fe-S cluster assembly iron-binding protein IscA
MALQVSDTAAEVIGEMLVEMDLPEGAGLRITIEAGDELNLSIEPEAQAGDRTTEDHGVTLFLDEQAATELDDKVLDAHRHGDHAHFSIEDQQQPA